MSLSQAVTVSLLLLVAGPAVPAARAEDDTAPHGSEIESMKNRIAALEERNLSSVTWPNAFRGLEMGGYIDVSYLYSFQTPDPAAGRSNRARLYDSEPNGFTANALSINVTRPMTADSPVGFETTLFFGDDAELMHSAGEGAGTEPFALSQAYVKARLPWGAGVDLKMGKFFTLLGAESTLSPLNWNFSRSLLFAFSQPGTHTGALLFYPISQWGTITAGIVNGWDIVDDNNKEKTFLGSLSLFPAKSVTLTVNGVSGAEQPDNNHDRRTVTDLVATVKLCERLSLMVNYDRGQESGLTRGAFNTPGPDTAHWEGLAIYARLDLNARWFLATRWESFHDWDNVRTAFTGAGGQTFNAVNYREATITSQWTFYERLISRLEYRRDRADQPVFFKDSNDFSGHQDTIALEWVLPF